MKRHSARQFERTPKWLKKKGCRCGTKAGKYQSGTYVPGYVSDWYGSLPGTGSQKNKAHANPTHGP